ncbi:hypothetical protein HEP84_25670 [Streptomyces sp. RLB1-33]|nr:hypothetical protein [Streptomyces sp. RLB1-33]QIY72031.1 hypothetical protein HEP84_25670 [Streptomyces sp. RLB1-33]
MNARTVTLETLDRGLITVPEPGWCKGHEGEPPQRYTDLTHNSVTVRAAGMLEAHLSQAPYLGVEPEPHPIVAVQLDCVEDFTAEDIPQLVEELRSVEKVLSFVAAEAIRLRGES